MSETKTHWLQNPNKNYLGHWDLPEGKDLILTIKSAKWEEVKNPIINKSEAKRVVRFQEENIKPFICNETNAQSILKCTGVKFMEDIEGHQIQLYVGIYNDKRTKQDIDCLRIRNEKPKPKEILSPLSKRWEKSKIKAQEGTPIEVFREHYQITDEDYNLLLMTY